ncbi:MAG TPA: response regulator transcription factor [Chloroflexota bacterium]|nr:response regulator transcription factor [Chloroflexota bacterium]
MAARVLLIDDEADVRISVARGLQAAGYEVQVARDGVEGLERLGIWRPDVVLTDLAMPRMNGLRVIQELRTRADVPVIVLSVMGDEEEKVRALDAGADDYLTKPFGLPELCARIRASLRRLAPPAALTVRQVGAVRVDLAARLVTVDGEEVHLTPLEYDLFKQLILNAGRVLTHGQLLDNAWGPRYHAETAYLRPVITSLRKKLGAHTIRTEPGIGYRMLAEVVPE